MSGPAGPGGAGARPGDPTVPAAGAAVRPGVGEWHRLHPLSPLVRAGRGAIAILVALAASTAGRANPSGDRYRLIVIGVALALGVVSWLVTRWRVEGDVLRIDTGVLRRTSQRFPLGQIQAVDTVRPGLARIFGLAELRLRMAAGRGKPGRLAYLGDAQAERLRAELLALAHGVDRDAPAPPELPLLTVPTGRLVASLLLSGPGLVAVAVVAALVGLAVAAPAAVGPSVGGGIAGLLALGGAVWRRFNGECRLTVAEAPDGLRVRSGLVETSAETIPRGRVQALRMTEPLLWRPVGWCRVEVDVAGRGPSGRQDRAARRAERALLPVGDRGQAAWLVARVLPGVPEPDRRPPARARWTSPLRFSRLSWGIDDHYAVTTSGRLCRVTDWVPLAKVQSIRQVEGPLQRRLALASVHLDTAGRSVRAVVRDADRAEAAGILAALPDRCRRARALDGRPQAVAATPPG